MTYVQGLFQRNRKFQDDFLNTKSFSKNKNLVSLNHLHVRYLRWSRIQWHHNIGNSKISNYGVGIVELNEVQDISYSLPLLKDIICAGMVKFGILLTRYWQNMSHDLFYYLSPKQYITVNHSGQNYIRDKKGITIMFQFISLIWFLAIPFSIFSKQI